MLTKECLTEIGKLFKKAQYHKCHRFILKCLSEYEENYRAAENNVSCDDICKKPCESGGSNIITSCSAVYKCIFQQNNEVCVFLCESKKSSGDEVKSACEKYSRLLQDMHGWAISEHHLEIEVIILHNFLVTLLGLSVLEVKQWSETAFCLISTALNRAFEVGTGSITSVHKSFTEEVTLLIDGILMHSESMTEMTLTSLSAVCYSAFYLCSINNTPFPVHCIKKIMSKIELACKIKKQQKCQRPGFVCLYPSNSVTAGVPSSDDSVQLLLACIYMTMKDFQAAYSSLERVTYLGWEHFVGYMKAFLLFKGSLYEQALEISWPLWKTKQKAEGWIVSKICNFIGCCLFKKGFFSMSIKWFQKAVNSEFGHLLPLWNMASAFKCLERKDASLEILKILEKASSVSLEPRATNLCCNSLWLQNQPEISHVQALYLLAHQSLSFGQYTLSTKYFTRILHILKEKPQEDLTYSVHFPVSVLDIYIEASYAYFHAGMHEDCLKTIDSITHYFPAANFMKKYETPFSWNINLKLPVGSRFNHYRNKTLSASKFDDLSLFPVNNHSVYFGQMDVEACKPVLMRNESDKNCLKLNNFVVKDVDGKNQCSPDCFRPNHIIHLMIQASAKYSLNCVSEAGDIFRRALVATTHYQGIQKNADATMLSKECDDSAAEFPKECCSACSDLTSSLVSQIYNNLAVIAISKNCLKEAAHNLRVAVVHDSGNIDAIYNYCVLQIQLEQLEVGRSFWEASKHKCNRIRSILASCNCDSSCTVTADLLKRLNEILSFEA